jgi:hypothetical protein
MDESKLMGFWQSHPGDGFPLPIPSNKPPYTLPLRRILLHYLSLHAYIESYEQAYSFCRFHCPESQANPAGMGLTTLTDGSWIWPEGLSHYVAVHHVSLPQDFVLHVLNACRTAMAPALRGDPVVHVDDSRCAAYSAELPALLPCRNHLLLGQGGTTPEPLPRAIASWLSSRTSWLKPERG